VSIKNNIEKIILSPMILPQKNKECELKEIHEQKKI
jgi:hypothetical protein